MDGGAWWAADHGVAKSQTRLSDFTFTCHFPALEKEMATHSSVLAWRIPGTGEPGGLPPMGLHRVGHDWSDLAAAAAAYPSRMSTIAQLGQSRHDVVISFTLHGCHDKVSKYPQEHPPDVSTPSRLLSSLCCLHLYWQHLMPCSVTGSENPVTKMPEWDDHCHHYPANTFPGLSGKNKVKQKKSERIKHCFSVGGEERKVGEERGKKSRNHHYS